MTIKICNRNLIGQKYYLTGLVITDQTSTDMAATKTEAEFAKKNGIHLMTIGVGNKISPRELQRLSSTERHIHRVDNFDGLEMILPQIRQEICESKQPWYYC